MKDGAARWHEVDALFQEALELPEELRAPFLESACRGDPALRQSVEALLRAERKATSFLERPVEEVCDPPWEQILEHHATPVAVGTDAVLPDRSGDRVGPFRLVRRVGRGGMATVYLAERADGQWEQRVALKIVRRGLDTEDVIRRFLAERQILSSLDHPNIARLLDGGTTDHSLPYLVMEYVEGTPITRYCDERRANVEERLRLFADVCRAVQYAHQNLVVHRDLKPANILVTGEGGVKLLDFGIARILDPAAGEPGTRTGFQPLTPEYASPEQVRGEPITTASDVYQLGLLLCELLSGRRPYRVRALSPARVEEAILTARPTRPSALVTEESARLRATGAERLARTLRGDLDHIALKAVRKEPERRYPSAEALASDVGRYVAGFPVSARPDTVGYRTRKLLRRRPWLAPAAATVLLAVGGYLFTVDRHARQLERERNVATGEAERAQEVKDLLVGLFRSADPFAPADPERGSRITVVEALDLGAERVRAELHERPAIQGELLASISEVLRSLGQTDRATPVGEEALGALERASGEPSVEQASVLRLLAHLAVQRDQRDSALALYTRALAAAEAALGADGPGAATYRASLGRFYFSDLARLDDARAHQERAVALLRSSEEPADADLAHTLYQLSETYVAMGLLAEARAALDEALPLARTARGADHPATAFVLVADAWLLQGEGRHAEAEAAYREALEILERALGAESDYVVSTLNNYAIMLGETGDLEGEEALHRRLLDIRRRTVGEEHSETASSMQNLATNLNRQGRYVEAEELLTEAGAIFRSALGPAHPRVAFPLLTKTEIRLKQGDHRGAEQWAIEAIGILRPALPEGHWIIAVAECRLGSALAGQGRREEARPLIEGALETLNAQAAAVSRIYVEECRAARRDLPPPR